MLVGSGGVVALVIGAWSVIWALRTLPSRTGRGWWPIACAFVAAMLGMSLIAAFEEPLLGFTGVIRGGHEERLAALEEVRSLWFRPLLAAVIGALALGAALFAGARLDKEPSARPMPEPDLAEKAGVALAGALAAAGLATLALFASTVGSVEPTIASVIDHAAQLQLLTRIGVALGSALVFLAALIGAWRVRRSLLAG